MLLTAFRNTGGLVTTGGLVDYGESCLNAAIRECLEEFGIKINPSQIIGFDEHENKSNNKKYMHYFAYVQDFEPSCVCGPQPGFENEIDRSTNPKLHFPDCFIIGRTGVFGLAPETVFEYLQAGNRSVLRYIHKGLYDNYLKIKS
jgi:hypothetical protein